MKMKRMIASLLTVAMVSSLNVGVAFAEDTTYVAKINDSKYTTLAAAVDAADEAKTETTITLLGDYSLQNEEALLRINGDVILDLGGHTLTTRNEWYNGTIYVYGEATIKNGTIEATPYSSSANYPSIYVISGDLTLDQVTLDSTNIEAANYALFVGVDGQGDSTGSNITLKDSTINSGSFIAIAEKTDFDVNNSTINIGQNTSPFEFRHGAEIEISFDSTSSLNYFDGIPSPWIRVYEASVAMTNDDGDFLGVANNADAVAAAEEDDYWVINARNATFTPIREGYVYSTSGSGDTKDYTWTKIAEALEDLLGADSSTPEEIVAATTAIANTDNETIAADEDLLALVNDLDAMILDDNSNLSVENVLSAAEAYVGTDEYKVAASAVAQGLAIAILGDTASTIDTDTVIGLEMEQTKGTDDTVTYDITPYSSTNNGVTKDTVANADLKAPITFAVPLSSAFANTNRADFYHNGEFVKTNVVYIKDSVPYTDVTTTSFSEFSFVTAANVSSSSSKSYYIKATATGNGTVAPEDTDVSPDSMYKVSKLSDVTFEFDADSGYEVTDVIVNGKSVGACDEYEFEDIILTMQTLEVVFEKKSSSSSSSDDDDDEDENEEENETEAIELPFADIDEDDNNFDGIAYVYENGIMAGITSEVFGSELSITRAMIAAILYRIDGSESVDADMSFADVAADQYYYEAVKWGKDAGIMAGMSATEFAPNTAITTEQFIAFLYRYASVLDMDMDADADLSGYGITDYAYNAMVWAVENDIIDKDDLHPTTEALRGDVATMLMNFMEMM